MASILAFLTAHSRRVDGQAGHHSDLDTVSSQPVHVGLQLLRVATAGLLGLT